MFTLNGFLFWFSSHWSFAPFLFFITFVAPFLLTWLVTYQMVTRVLRLKYSKKQIFILSVFISIASYILFITSVFGFVTIWERFSDRLFSTLIQSSQEEMVFSVFPFFFVFNYLVFTLPPLYVLIYLQLRNDLKKRKRFSPALGSFIVSVVSSFVSCVFAVFFLFSVVAMTEGNCWRELNIFNEFNAHIKSLCGGEDKSFCPRTEDELSAFNHQNYQQLQSCGKTAYDFNEETETATWIVRWYDDNIFISHPQFYPGFGYYHRFKPLWADEEWNNYIYPPKIDGPWEILK